MQRAVLRAQLAAYEGARLGGCCERGLEGPGRQGPGETLLDVCPQPKCAICTVVRHPIQSAPATLRGAGRNPPMLRQRATNNHPNNERLQTWIRTVICCFQKVGALCSGVVVQRCCWVVSARPARAHLAPATAPRVSLPTAPVTKMIKEYLSSELRVSAEAMDLILECCTGKPQGQSPNNPG